MPIQHRVLLHRDGPALWPEHKPEREIRELQGSTPETIWEATYQGNPTPPGGVIFRREWWRGQNRYDASDQGLVNKTIGRWLSFDTAEKDKESNAFTACVVGELQPDYHLIIRQVWRDRLQFPDLPDTISGFARRYNVDGKLRGVIIEDKSTGTSAYQTLMASTAEAWLQELLIAFMPSGDKVTRAQQAGVWCRNDCVWLPYPGDEATWLLDFEDELFSFPGSTFKDQVDAFGQLILYLELMLADGWRARNSA